MAETLDETRTDRLRKTVRSKANAAEKSRLETLKLELEVRDLQAKTGTSARLLALYWPVIGGLLTFFLGFLAITNQHRDANAANQRAGFEKNAKLHELLNSAIQAATDKTQGPARRMAGVWSLDEFWKDDPDYEPYETAVASTLTASLLDDDVRVHCEASQVLGEAITAPDGFHGGKSEKHSATIARLLYGDGGHVGIVTRLNSVLRVLPRKDYETSASDLKDKPPVRWCITSLDATKEAIRRNWEYLRNVNLEGTDLSGAQFYEADLSGARFKNVDLTGTNLRCANLSMAILKGPLELKDVDLYLTNITGIRDPSGYLSKHSGAEVTTLTEEQWERWRRNGFSLEGRDKPVIDRELKSSEVRELKEKFGDPCIDGPH